MANINSLHALEETNEVAGLEPSNCQSWGKQANHQGPMKWNFKVDTYSLFLAPYGFSSDALGLPETQSSKQFRSQMGFWIITFFFGLLLSSFSI